MLFPLHRDTPNSLIFIALNRELLRFLRTSINAQYFDRDLFSLIIGEVCWNNDATREKFKDLWDELQNLTVIQRRTFYNEINNKQDISIYFIDKILEFPNLNSAELTKKLACLTKHLYNSTKDLIPIKRACGETLVEHFNAYCRLNYRLCQACGTELLSQPRTNIEEGKQWRSAYDHLLCKTKHAAYGIHPNNLLPLCYTCNSKAKGVKELLIKKQGNRSVRRLSFYPQTESCMDVVTAKLIECETSLSLSIDWVAMDAAHQEKIVAWDEVYQVKSRVEGIDADIILKINDDCDQPLDLDDFKNQLARKAIIPNNRALRSEPMKFWRYKLYEWLSNESNDLIEAIWEMIEQRRDDDNYREEYGI
jgi:hypothetical protein